MKFQKIATICALVCAGLVLSPAIQAEGKTVTAKEIKWGVNPSLPKGNQFAVLSGDPATGASVVRVRMPANSLIMPHSHVTENVLTMISGTGLYAEGDKVDEKKMKAYPAGSFIVETPNVPHYMKAKTAIEFQVSIPGKATFNYVDPKDDPSKK
jgi:quercetin dioxygenase-like cupin family protein